MKSLLSLPRCAAAIVALLPAVGAPLLRAADPIPFPPLAAPDGIHIAPTLVHRVEPAYPNGIEQAAERRVGYVRSTGAVRHRRRGSRETMEIRTRPHRQTPRVDANDSRGVVQTTDRSEGLSAKPFA